MLRALGIQPKLRGFACLREAVLICAREEHQSVTKILYPEVARRCGCAATHVERNIRSAIQDAWASRNENVWRLYFTPNSSGDIPRPTNAAVISRLADSIRTRKSEGEAFVQKEQNIYKNIG
jgi:two-component system response regulator (stage 0 sporulation protein A)